MRFILFFLLLLMSITGGAQKLLPTPKNIQAGYDKGTRSIDGKPGKNYWQNRADYDLNISFDPASRLISGTVDISYVNNSPDTLKQVYFKLYPNLYKKGAPRNGNISPNDITDGVIIDSFFINNSRIENGRLAIQGTNAILGKQNISPKGKIDFRIAYHYTLNKGSHMRTGEVDSGAHFIAYFFPRVTVYDDIDGWNSYPYLGNLEFYNDFGNFKAFITVPDNTFVWATGDLVNASEVLDAVYVDRLREAERSDELLFIIDSNDAKKNRSLSSTSKKTWKFEASNVTDFAFATSNHYVWQSGSLVVDPVTKRRTRIDAVFNPVHADYFHVAVDAWKTVEAMSYRFPAWPFPYPHITVFDGLDQMEYPMMVNDNPVEDRVESITLTDHEVFHTIFPFYMGTNETKYAWMDEGWATIGEWVISPMIDSSIVDEYGVAPTASNAGKETDLPIMTLSTELNRGYFTNSYPKPAMGYLYVKDLLGETLFKKALHNYISNWNGKHPLPNDFFYSMNSGAGRNLNWFWKKWFFDPGVPDLGLGSVKKAGTKITAVVKLVGEKPVPIDLTVYYKDGTKTSQHRNIGVWEKGAKAITLTITVTKAVDRLELGHPHTPDSDKTNNVFRFK